MIKNWKAVEWLSVTDSNIKITVDKVLRSRYSTKMFGLLEWTFEKILFVANRYCSAT